MVDVIIDGLDLPLIRVEGVLGGDKRGFAQAGIIAGDDIGIQAIGVVETPQTLLRWSQSENRPLYHLDGSRCC